MSTQIQRRKGTTAEHSTFTGAEAELTVDTTKDTVVVHDGSTAGGHPLQKQYPALGSASTPTYTFTGDTNTGIYSPGADQVAISTNGARRLYIDSTGALTVDTGDATIYGVRVGRGAGAISSNTAIGNGALNANTIGDRITAIGSSALANLNNGSYGSTAVGAGALGATTTGGGNAFGMYVLTNNTTGDNNSAFGGFTSASSGAAMQSNTTGSRNNAFGTHSLGGNITGNDNCVFGSDAGRNAQASSNNSYFGSWAGVQNTGSNNVGVGMNTLYAIGSGGNNIALGYNAGSALTDGSNNTIIGNIAGTAGLANTVIIGAGSTERLRIDSSGNVGIGTSAPGGNLQISQITDGDTALKIVRKSDSGGGAGYFANFNSASGATSITSISTKGDITATTLLLKPTNKGTGSLTYILDAGDTTTVQNTQGYRFRQKVTTGGATTVFSIEPTYEGGATYTSLLVNSTDTSAGAASKLIDLQSGGTSRFAVLNSGNVGIGTTSPAVKTHIYGSQTALRIESSSTDARIQFTSSSGTWVVGNSIGGAGNNLSFFDLTAFAERARIDSSGRLLVGTKTSPSSGNGAFAKAVVQGNTADPTATGYFSIQRGEAAATIANNESIGFLMFNDNAGKEFARVSCVADADAVFTSNSPGRLVFSTTADGASSPTERMRITSAGAVLTGRTTTTSISPGAVLQSTNLAIEVGGDQTGAWWNRTDSTAAWVAQRFNAQGSLVGFIQVNTSSVTYSTTSDYRLKENVIPLTGASERLKQIPVHRFNFIAEPDKTVDGFIAHEAQAIVPECATGEKDAVEVWKEGEDLPDGVVVGDNKLDDDGNTIPVYQGVDQSKLVPLLTAALQEALAKIEVLEQRLTDAGIA